MQTRDALRTWLAVSCLFTPLLMPTPAAASCPNPIPDPTNNIPHDMEPGLPLLFSGPLNTFNIYWSDHWDSNNRFKVADIENALKEVIATPYFDNLCQYGVTGFRWEGGTTTDRFFQTCPRHPGPVTFVFPQTLDFLSCEEGSLGTGVPSSNGLPNPLTCGTCLADPIFPHPCYYDPICTATPNATGSRIYNLLLPDDTMLAEAGVNCSNFAAFHFQIPSQPLPNPIGPPFFVPLSQGRPIIFTVIPTVCFSDLANLIGGITHEMVEASIDPLPMAHWVDESESIPFLGRADIGDWGKILKDGEASDLCPGYTYFTAPSGTRLGVARYWSNHDDGCVSLDVTPPVTHITLTPAPNFAQWNHGAVSVSLSATDSESGVRDIIFGATGAQTIGPDLGANPTTFTVSSEGITNVTYYAEDNAGNVENSHAVNVRIDLTPPGLSAGRSPDPNEAGWNNTPVSVTFACSDALSGVQFCTPTQTVGEGGGQGAGGLARDVAGNETMLTVSPINVDLSPPVISGAAIPPANAAGWNNTNVVVEFSCTDAVSAVASCASPILLTSEGIGQSATGQAVDLAGNTASTTVGGINIDQTPPIVSYAGNAGTYTVDQQVDITCSASDNLSGIASNSCSQITGPAYAFGLGTSSDSATVVDNAGNAATATVQFTVIVTFDSLCSLTTQFLNKPQLSTSFCDKLAQAKAAPNDTAKRNQLDAFKNQVSAQSGKAMTTTQADVLRLLADAL